MIAELLPNISMGRRRFLSYSLRFGKLFFLLSAIGAILPAETLRSQVGDARPPSAPSNLRITTIGREEFDNTINGLTAKWEQLNRDTGRVLSSEKLKMQREISRKAAEDILKAKGYSVPPPPTNLQIQ